MNTLGGGVNIWGPRAPPPHCHSIYKVGAVSGCLKEVTAGARSPRPLLPLRHCDSRDPA